MAAKSALLPLEQHTIRNSIPRLRDNSSFRVFCQETRECVKEGMDGATTLVAIDTQIKDGKNEEMALCSRSKRFGC
jgi:hypothetical protein